MSLITKIISKTAGRFSPKLRTIAEFSETYLDIIKTRGLSQKTLNNRAHYVSNIVRTMGDIPIGSVKPHQIATAIASIAGKHPTTGKRTLTELKDMLNEALMAGWIDVNQAVPVRPPRIRISRQRLSIEAWSEMLEWARENSPPWVPHLLILALVTGQRRGDLHKMKFSDVWDGYLHIIQQKRNWAHENGARVAMPLHLTLPGIGIKLGDAIEACRSYAPMPDGEDSTLIRKSTGKPLCLASMSWRFEEAREGVLGKHSGKGLPPSLHECRSLSCRLYEKSGIDTKDLLGHRNRSMTDVYADDRGLAARESKWITLVVDNSSLENSTERAAA